MPIKRVVLLLIYLSGFLKIWRFLRRSRITILMLHSVMDTEVPAAWESLRPQLTRKRLEDSIRLLSKYYQFVSLQETVEMLNGERPVRPYSLVVTFDDGYRNNIKYALPILRKYGVPATIFVSTSHVEQRKPFWVDRLDYALQQVPVDGRVVCIGDNEIRLKSKDRDSLCRSYKQLRDMAKEVKRDDNEMLEELDKITLALESESGRSLNDIFESDNWSAALTWKEIRKASSDDLTFGSHTVDHIRLGFVDDATIRDQLIRSKEAIEVNIDKKCEFLCYPDGSFSSNAVEIARDCGYKAAVTVVQGTNCVGDNLLTLKRFNLPEHGNKVKTLMQICGLLK